jgi:hypothetical protein
MTDVRLWIDVALLVVGVVASWVSMREQLKGVREDVADATRALSLVQRRLDDHERRITIVERDSTHLGRQLDSSLARIEGQVGALHARLDALFERFASGGGEQGR